MSNTVIEKKIEELTDLELLSIKKRLKLESQRIEFQLDLVAREIKLRVDIHDRSLIPPPQPTK